MSGKHTNRGYPCPCCGYLTRGEPDFGTFEICPVCGWEDDGVQYDEPDYPDGANPISLNTARRNYQALGAISKEWTKQVRRPEKDEIPDVNERG